jgi:hypothetical protein
MGQRFRLKSGYNTNGFSHDAKVIADALKKYGMILADNGSAIYISGVPNAGWNNDVLHELDVIQGSDFEAVDESSLMVDPNSGQANTGTQGNQRLSLAVTGSGSVASNPGGIACPGDCTQDFAAGTPVDLYAQAADGWNFDHWVGACNGSDPVCSVTMTTARQVTAVFTPAPGTDWLTIRSPNGGEKWRKRSTHAIRWDSSDFSGNVKIEISYNGGSTWKSVAKSTLDDGSYSWKLPNKRTTAGRIRITSTSDLAVRDSSDANFTIR